jgi:hypothetical protein
MFCFFLHLFSHVTVKVSAAELPPKGGWAKSKSPVLSLFNLRERSKFWDEKVILGGERY